VYRDKKKHKPYYLCKINTYYSAQNLKSIQANYNISNNNRYTHTYLKKKIEYYICNIFVHLSITLSTDIPTEIELELLRRFHHRHV